MAFNDLSTKQQEYLMANFGKDEAKKIGDNPYYSAYSTGGAAAGIKAATGSDDPNVVSEIDKQWRASGKRLDQFLNEVAANPSAYSKTLGDQTATTEATKIADPSIAKAKTDLAEQQGQSQTYLDRVLASRGLTNSGAVGAGLTDIAGKYAKALADASSNININATNQARGREYANYDKQVAQTYADKINEQLMGKIGEYKQSQGATLWDYAANALKGAVAGGSLGPLGSIGGGLAGLFSTK